MSDSNPTIARVATQQAAAQKEARHSMSSVDRFVATVERRRAVNRFWDKVAGSRRSR